jgi:membrane-associated HD superfamily phosphohydrolase
MTTDRGKKAVIATIATVIWLAYMVVGLALINHFAPTTGGEGPDGAAAFLGLVGGVVVVGLIMWAASE